MPHVAVILSGCGVYDGAEIHEAVCTLLALEEAGATYRCLAPNVDQLHVIDHRTGDPTQETRNVLTESARIARGAIDDLADANADVFDAVILPGGFGAAKNLSTFAIAGSACSVNADLVTFLKAAHAAGKPIGALCIAPAVLAKVFAGQTKATVGVTIGTAKDYGAKIDDMGARHVDCPVDDIVIDNTNRLVTSPCYMLAGSVSEVMGGARKTVQQVLRMATAEVA